MVVNVTLRDTQMRDFIADAGWSDASQSVLAGDASNRRYDRLSRADGSTAILMDAPPMRGEDVRPFIEIAQHFIAIGLSAPQILNVGADRGFLLIEDLGDALFSQMIYAQPKLETPFYTAAIDVLVHLHAASLPDLPVFDAATLAPMVTPAFDWYKLGAIGESDPQSSAKFVSAFQRLLAPLDNAKQILIHRDFHTENLLWLPERSGVARVGLLDFQDAKRGHAAYDLVSILQDARRDVSPIVAVAMIDHYLEKSKCDRDELLTAYALLGAQRNLRILGVFARLCIRDGKPHYVDLIPRVWDHVQTNLAHPALRPVADLVRTHLPPPTPEILEKLKSQCANRPDP